MATAIDFIEFVCEQIQSTGEVRYKKMFGEFMVYVNDKPVLLVCDNTVYVKMLPCLEKQMEKEAKGFPYKGAKEHYILDIDNKEFSEEIVTLLESVSVVPKPRKKPTKNK